MTLINHESALTVIDYTKDFSHPDGSLYVQGSEVLVSTINALMENFSQKEGQVIITKDWHPAGHISFASRHGVEPFTLDPTDGHTLVRPDHSVQNTWGAEFVDGMRSDLANHEIKKGVEKDDRLDSYSGFAHTDLDEYLKEKKIKKHFIAGVATDWCVIETAKDSLKNGYETYIVTDAVRGVDESTTAAIYEAFEAMGGKLITSKEILEAA